MDSLLPIILCAIITNGSSRKANYKSLIEKVQQKLSGWKQNCLSLAGRLTLQSVTSQLPIYHMQHGCIPSSTLREIEKLERNFIRNSSEDKQKVQLVSWDQLCKPKNVGGYGLINLNIMNDALLSKLVWNFISRPNSLCSRVIKGKYGRDDDWTMSDSVKQSDLHLWKKLVSLWLEVTQNAAWKLGDGSKIHIWSDVWIDDSSLLISNTSPNMVDLTAMVKDFINTNGDWDLSSVDALLTENMKSKILSIIPPSLGSPCDSIHWKLNSNGRFTISSMYQFLSGENNDRVDRRWSQVWRWEGSKRIQTFLWLAIGEKLMICVRREKIFQASPLCSLCGKDIETVLQAMRDCAEANFIWRLLVGNS